MKRGSTLRPRRQQDTRVVALEGRHIVWRDRPIRRVAVPAVEALAISVETQTTQISLLGGGGDAGAGAADLGAGHAFAESGGEFAAGDFLETAFARRGLDVAFVLVSEEARDGAY